MKGCENISKNGRCAKLSQKAEDVITLKKLKDGEKNIRNSKRAKLSARLKDGQNYL
jgi:hypothetical protein